MGTLRGIGRRTVGSIQNRSPDKTPLITPNIGRERGLIAPTSLAVGVVMAVVTTLTAMPLLDDLYLGSVAPDLDVGAGTSGQRPIKGETVVADHRGRGCSEAEPYTDDSQRGSMPTTETLDRVKGVIRACLKVDERAVLEDTMPLVGGEYDLDSLDILLIITELEREFGVKIRDDAMNRAAFENIESLCAFVDALPSGGPAGVS